eukprot:6598664-Pyramimonas_sp.AAC.3
MAWTCGPGAQAAVAILYAEVMRKLLIMDKVSFAVRMQLPNTPFERPVALALPFKRKDVVRTLANSPATKQHTQKAA